MPFPQAIEILEHWDKLPPPAEMLHILAEAFTNFERPRPSENTTDPDEVRNAIQQMGGSTRPVDEMPEWMKLSLAAYQHNPEMVN